MDRLMHKLSNLHIKSVEKIHNWAPDDIFGYETGTDRPGVLKSEQNQVWCDLSFTFCGASSLDFGSLPPG
jgi:hypothetical protein